MNFSQRVQQFVSSMWSWNARHRRRLPWRDLDITDDTQRAYMILVSEVMLQQTQVPRVEIIFKRFLEQFPTIHDLARASNKDVIIAWRGMGYNSRALRLRDAARIIVEQYAGVFPKEMNELLAIKGIGSYTAAAIRNFAFNLPTPCIDTNIRRILHRVFVGPEAVDGTFRKNDRELMPISDRVVKIALNIPLLQIGEGVPEGRGEGQSAANWHAALMDFGSLVCTKRSPQCDSCPMAKNGTCKSAFRVPAVASKKTIAIKREPGRFVGSVFIPNRIFRGRIIEALRDASGGLTAGQLGPLIAIDWEATEHMTWLMNLLTKLQKDHLIIRRAEQYHLHH